MGIEQTSQLILLILNSALMLLLSAVMVGGAWLRQQSLALQLQQVRSRYRRLTQNMTQGPIQPAPSAQQNAISKIQIKAELKQVREHRQRLKNQYLWSHLGMLMLHMGLTVFSVSLFALALRSLLSFDSLIPAALFLFTVGSGGLLAGASCLLIDMIQGSGSGDSLARALGQILAQLVRKWQRVKPQTKPQWPSKSVALLASTKGKPPPSAAKSWINSRTSSR
ncbi:MAG: hypothetical protein WA885_18300 [Phormidesmis sp.]